MAGPSTTLVLSVIVVNPAAIATVSGGEFCANGRWTTDFGIAAAASCWTARFLFRFLLLCCGPCKTAGLDCNVTCPCMSGLIWVGIAVTEDLQLISISTSMDSCFDIDDLRLPFVRPRMDESRVIEPSFRIFFIVVLSSLGIASFGRPPFILLMRSDTRSGKGTSGVPNQSSSLFAVSDCWTWEGLSG